MELYPTTNSLGYEDLWWSIRQEIRYLFSRDWPLVTAVVEGYELRIAGRGHAFFIAFYSYAFGGNRYSGEWRKSVSFLRSSRDDRAARMIQRLPRGSTIRARVHPQHPERSIAEL